jgi:hypothetical protein
LLIAEAAEGAEKNTEKLRVLSDLVVKFRV